MSARMAQVIRVTHTERDVVKGEEETEHHHEAEKTGNPNAD